MRSWNELSIFCSSFMIYALCQTPAIANDPAKPVADLPPAIAMLKNLKKTSTERPIVSKPIAAQTLTKPVKTQNVKTNFTVPKYLAMLTKPTSKKSDLHAPILSNHYQVPKYLMASNSKTNINIKVQLNKVINHDAPPRVIQQNDALLSHFQSFKSRVSRHFIFLGENSHAQPVIPIASPFDKKDSKKEEAKHVAAKTVSQPVKTDQRITMDDVQFDQADIRKRQKELEKSIAEAKAREATEQAMKQERENRLNAVAAGLSNRESVSAHVEEERKPIEINYLPKDAQIIAGNPFTDEFFIIGEGTPKKLRNQALAAKDKTYLPTQVEKGQKKELTETVVTRLINNVTAKNADVKQYVPDPIEHHVISKKISVPLQSAAVSTKLTKPQFKSENIVSRQFVAHALSAKASVPVAANKKKIATPVAVSKKEIKRNNKLSHKKPVSHKLIRSAKKVKPVSHKQIQAVKKTKAVSHKPVQSAKKATPVKHKLVRTVKKTKTVKPKQIQAMSKIKHGHHKADKPRVAKHVVKHAKMAKMVASAKKSR